MIKLNQKGFAHWILPILVVALIAAIGTYVLTRSNANGSTPIATIPADQMTLPAGASVIDDTTASTGKAVLLTQKGSLTGTVNLPSSATSLTVVAKAGSQCESTAKINVKIDNITALKSKTIKSANWASLSSSTLDLTKGDHTMKISFISSNARCAHSLYVDVTNFYGPTPPPPTVSISVTPTSVLAGQSSTLTWTSTNANTGCTASGSWSGAEPTSGSTSTGAVNANSTYTLTCTGANGTATASATVTVTGSGGPGPVTGASTAVCNPSPCTPGIVPTTTTNVVNLGTINNGSVGQTRTYGYYIPQNLLHDGSAQGKPAAVFDLSRTSCGTAAANGEYLNSKMGPVADANRFIIVELECTSGTNNWIHPETDCGGAGGVNGAGTCDASTAPSDEPYIKAAVADATTRFNLDAARRYLIGGSSAANMARDAICSNSQSPHNATLFRGIMTMGGGANAKLNTNSGVCPSGDKTTFWLALMGKNSQADPYSTVNIPSMCTTTCDHTILGFDATRSWWAGYLGNCSAAMHSTTGSGVLSDIYDYTCSDGNSTSPFFEAVAVSNGGHMWCGLDSSPAANCAVGPNNTGGWSTATYTWNYFAKTTTTK